MENISELSKRNHNKQKILIDDEIEGKILLKIKKMKK